jgi:hypothetical protein
MYQILVMSNGFNPEQFRASVIEKTDPDADWMRLAEKLPESTCQAVKKKARYIPAIPRNFLRAAAAAGNSLELLLVALAEMRMRGTREITIGPGLWEQIGDPSKRVRTRLLRQIAALPSSLCTLTARNGRPHLLSVGKDWPVASRLLR